VANANLEATVDAGAASTSLAICETTGHFLEYIFHHCRISNFYCRGKRSSCRYMSSSFFTLFLFCAARCYSKSAHQSSSSILFTADAAGSHRTVNLNVQPKDFYFSAFRILGVEMSMISKCVLKHLQACSWERKTCSVLANKLIKAALTVTHAYACTQVKISPWVPDQIHLHWLECTGKSRLFESISLQLIPVFFPSSVNSWSLIPIIMFGPVVYMK
jgi:hypothetical protein